MYTTINTFTEQPIRAFRPARNPKEIWCGVQGASLMALSPAEAQQLITELQRELREIEAMVRGVVA